MAVRHNAIDWSPLLPRLRELMKEGQSLRKIATVLGVSDTALSSAIERRVPVALRSEWNRKRQGPVKETRAQLQKREETRDPFPTAHPTTWGAIWGGNPPPYPG